MILQAEKTNTGRQPEFDIAKTVAIFCMVLIHVADNMGTITNQESSIAAIVLDFIGGPLAAPVFMFAMGVGMVYTRHDTPGAFAKRGLILLLMGYALNFFRETILLIGAHLLSFDTAYDKALIDTIGTVDILHFAGVAFLIAALMKKLRFTPQRILAAALLMQVVGSLFNGMFDGLPKAVQYLLGLLFFTNTYVAFPALLWFLYPAAGICFATLLQHATDKTKLYRAVQIGGAIAFAATTLGTIATNTDLRTYFMGTDYYNQNLFSVLWTFSVVAIFMGWYYRLSEVLPAGLQKQVQTTAAQVNTVYVIQWLVITYSIAGKEIAGIGYLPDAAIVPVGIAYALVSIAAARCVCMIKNRKGRTGK